MSSFRRSNTFFFFTTLILQQDLSQMTGHEGVVCMLLVQHIAIIYLSATRLTRLIVPDVDV